MGSCGSCSGGGCSIGGVDYSGQEEEYMPYDKKKARKLSKHDEEMTYG
ncbi:MAG: hypothetical protein V3R86_02275 [Candidatus Hydrothermarchaeaceae archaeon]